MSKVLVIDDSIFALKSNAEIVGKAGCEVVTAESGEAGLAAYASHRPQIVLCDLIMPKMDGFEVLRAIKELGSATVFFMVTANIQKEMREKAIDLGAQGVLAKPLTEAMVKHIVDEYAK